MIDVQYLGQLGNNLFQYALGRILAEELGLELRCGRSPGGDAGTSLETQWQCFKDCPQSIPGRRAIGPDVEEILLSWHRIDLTGLLAQPHPRHIVLNGWFQRTEYYAPYRDRVRRWFAPATDDDSRAIRPGDLLILLRRASDYFMQGITLDLEYYERILAGTSFDRLFISGDVLGPDVRRRFARYQPTYLRGPALEQFQLARRFDRMVMANSTFSWWVAFLSNAREVYFPRPERGFWAPDPIGHDLEVDDARYICVDRVPLEPIPLARRLGQRAGTARTNLSWAIRHARQPRTFARALLAPAPNGQIPQSVRALPRVFVQAPRRDPHMHRADDAGRSARCLVIQSDGRHKGQDALSPNWYLRECYALQHAFQQNNIPTDVWGRGHAGYGDPPDFQMYDYLVCAENSDLSWVPDLSRATRPLKLQWIIDLHCGPEPYRAVSARCDIILHSTRSLMAAYASQIPDTRHVWFPNGCDDRYFEATKWPLPKVKDVVFVGTARPERARIVGALQKRIGLEWFFCTGIEMIGTVASARIHFNQSIKGDLNFRVFETIGLGTCLLTDRQPDLAMLGFVDGVNCLLYDTVDDAANKARQALREGTWERIGAAGHALAERHSYTARVRALMEGLKAGGRSACLKP
jgi:hypothetical protein